MAAITTSLLTFLRAGDHVLAEDCLEVRGGEAETAAVLGRLRLAIVAPSVGGVHTLVMRPARVSHAGLTAEERARLGIGDRLIRVSVGIESADELCADFAQAPAGH
jgi:cystathionine beta-lyase/cystathionine gamma-synthase